MLIKSSVMRFHRSWVLPYLANLLFCLFLLVMIWGAAFWQVNRDREFTINAVMHDGDKFSRAFEEHVRQILKTNDQYITLMKAEYERAQVLTPGINSFLQQMAKDPLIIQMALIDLSGNFIASFLPSSDNLNFSDRSFFQAHMADPADQLFINQPIVGRISQKISIPISRRLNHSDGSFAGSVYIALDPEYFTKFYRDMNFNEYYVVRVVGLDGVVRASNAENEIGHDLHKATIFERIAEKPDGFYRSPGAFFGKPRLMSYRSMPDYPLVVQVGMAEEALYPLQQRRFTYLIAAGGISLFILFYTGVLIARSRRQRQIETKLRLSEEKYFKAFHVSPDSININRIQDGKFIEINDGFTRITGYTWKDVAGKTSVDFEIWVDLNDRARMLEELANRGEVCNLEISFRRKDGSILYGLMSVKKIEVAGEDCLLSIVRDITANRQSEERVKFLSLHDSLTGAYNRTYFEEEILHLKAREYTGIGVFVCDVDGLKLINDTLGHHYGDELLKEVVAILNARIEQPDFTARIGGDEFAVILCGTTKRQIENLEEQYKEAVAEYNDKNPHLPLSLSFGWAFDAECNQVDRVFKEADHNMYRQKMHQSHSVRGAIVQTMMKALEARDHISEGHADRLGEMMERMGQKLHFSQGNVADLCLFAKFHDIGKVGIPDSILNKPGQLTSEEATVMRRHCEIGFRIARSSPDLEPIADWILKHQEHWDGNGYPLGLTGEDIPIECRILGIIDAFDAMTNDRPYREAMSFQDAIAEIKRCAGTQFDPELAEVFIKMMESKLS